MTDLILGLYNRLGELNVYRVYQSNTLYIYSDLKRTKLLYKIEGTENMLRIYDNEDRYCASMDNIGDVISFVKNDIDDLYNDDVDDIDIHSKFNDVSNPVSTFEWIKQRTTKIDKAIPKMVKSRKVIDLDDLDD